MSEMTLPTTTTGPGFAVICSELFVRRMLRLPIIENARSISAHYNGDIVIPLPEVNAEERPAVANLIAQNIDQHAMRVASVAPSVSVAPSAAGKATALKLARTQRRVLLSWDEDEQRELFDRRRARWLTAWAEAPVVVLPDRKLGRPVLELRNPLGSYPNPHRQYDDMLPIDHIATFERTYQWLKQRYPQLDSLVNLGRKPQYRADDRFEVIEYVDAEVIVTGVLGTGVLPPFGMLADLGFVAFDIPKTSKGQTYAIELERTPNLTENCLAVTPGRITLDRPKGLVDDMVGIFQMEAKMLALHVNAVARAIYPNDWFVKTETGGQIIRQADGLKGIMGEVEGGQVTQLGMTPGVQTMGVINALERNSRIAGAAPSEYGGEAATNVRTAQRGLNIASAAIDFYIQEHQQLIARAKKHEYDLSVLVDRAYFKNRKKTFYVHAGPNAGEQTYVPGELWSTAPRVKVRYNYAGMDANAINIANGQKLGEGTISRETVMEYDSAIEDVESELGRITGDRLNDALLAAVAQQAQAGSIAPVDVAQIVLYVQSGDYTLADAVAKVQKEAQARQAATTGTAQPGSPEAQVGLQAGPQGAAQPTIAPPNQSQQNLRSLVAALKAGG